MAPTCFVLMYEPQFHSSGNAHSNSQNSLLEQLSWMAVEVQAVRRPRTLTLIIVCALTSDPLSIAQMESNFEFLNIRQYYYVQMTRKKL